MPAPKLTTLEPRSPHPAPSTTPHTAAELNTVLQLLIERDTATIAIGHGRDPHSIAAAAALAAAWQQHGGSVLDVISWPARAASWLRQARRLAGAHPDAWVIADSAQGFAPMAARLVQQPDWSPAHTFGFAGLADDQLITRVAPAHLHRLSGATTEGGRWRIGRATLIFDAKAIASDVHHYISTAQTTTGTDDSRVSIEQKPPARNRVTPLGDIVALAGRGSWMGNRGRLHEGADSRDIVRDHQNKNWLTCALTYKDRTLPQWQPGHYTQLFFLDEAVALAAGHRPCAECRRPAYNAYRTGWSDAHLGTVPRARDMDEQLHRERRPAGPTSRPRTSMPWPELPDGAFVDLDEGPAVVVGDHLAVWDHVQNTYSKRLPRPREGNAPVITPPSSVAVLRAGYPVQIDASAR